MGNDLTTAARIGGPARVGMDSEPALGRRLLLDRALIASVTAAWTVAAVASLGRPGGDPACVPRRRRLPAAAGLDTRLH